MRESYALLVAAGLLVAAACAGPRENPPAAAPQAMQAASPAGIGATRSSANGRAIYQTGADLAGIQIHAKPRTAYPSCAACHKADGSGGIHLPGGAVSADLRHKAIVSGKHPYTVASLERAISTGVDNGGQLLNPVMPRWQLTKQDLHDAAVYVYTQLK